MAPWGVTAPTGIVYITTSQKINTIFCAGNPDFRADRDLKDILDNNVLNTPIRFNPGDFTNVIGKADTGTSTFSSNTANIGGVIGAVSNSVLQAIKDIPWYRILILLLLLIPTGFILYELFRKDIFGGVPRMSFMRAIAALSIATVLNVLNSISFILSPEWLKGNLGITLPWLLFLDVLNLVVLVVLAISTLFVFYGRLLKTRS